MKIQESDIVLVFVLRSALAFLDASLLAFPSARVAFTGLRRDEKTAEADWYYQNIPQLTKKNTLILCDPMLATGGSSEKTIQQLLKHGASPKKMHFVGIIAAPEGVRRIARHIPKKNILVAATDPGLDAKKFIVPGLGDFGDRYFASV